MRQADFFQPALPAGLIYRKDFITAVEEQALVAEIQGLPLQEARYQQYTARRRTVNYGFSYDFTHLKSDAAPPIPEFLSPLRTRAAEWLGLQPGDFVQALIAEYRPGTQLGWHRDVPDYEQIVGISLAGHARLRFRPYPWSPEKKSQMFALELAPRSAYILRDQARWGWQHHVPPTKELRYSITFRTAGDEVQKRTTTSAP
ncbi:alpha-ketoglutarate-dependent dioxygenase AlkB [Peristeroidobacter soli]|uniref:alpha-ketoglutarate-dependent dioxygenase AlkB n=1 Tax=Peristeroidobacter soli TaxID=2497877 RepID=UPI00101CB58D|nr:alpha-ketoglutarate-dependent dioxygenase AlkB [Peristeroidobacter soli]